MSRKISLILIGEQSLVDVYETVQACLYVMVPLKLQFHSDW